MKQRRDLLPGDVFLLSGRGFISRRDAVLVVLDRRTEVDFWRGGLWAVGDVAPELLVEVLS